MPKASTRPKPSVPRKSTPLRVPKHDRFATVRRAAPYLLLLFFTLVFYRNVLFGSDTFIPWDLPLYHVPQAVFASQSLRNGHFPLWDPNVYCGRPLYAEVQASYFYPFRLLTVLLVPPTPHVTLLRAMEIELVLHVFLAGVFTLWLARRLGLGEPAALMSATAYCLGFYYASQMEHIGCVETATWFPLALLAVILLKDKPTLARFLLLTVSMAMILLAGFTPSAILFFVAIILVALLYTVLLHSGAKLLILTLAGSVMGFLLAGVQMLPTMQLSMLSIGHLRYLWKGTGGGIRPAVLKSLISPNALGVYNWSTFDQRYEITLSYMYCGLVVAALAIFAMVFQPSRKKLVWSILFVTAGVLMLGDHTPIGTALFVSLPHFIQSSVYVEHWMGVFALSIALLSGFGLEQVPFLKKWGHVLVLLSAADLIWAGSNKLFNSVQYDPGSITLDSAVDGEPVALAAVRQTLDAHIIPPYRIDEHKDNGWASWPLLTGVPSANGVDPLSITRLLESRQRLHDGVPWAIRNVDHVEPKLLSFLNVRYFMSREPLGPADLERSKFVLKSILPASRYFYENPNVLPRFFFVRRVVPSSGEQDSLRLINRAEWDPAQEAVVEGIPSRQDTLAAGTVDVERYDDAEVVLRVHTAGDAFLSTSEAHYPGWRASIDGRDAPLYYSNAAFRGLFVPPGDHQVVFRFRPAILVEGAGATLLAIAILCAAAWFSGAGHEYWTKFRWFLSLALFRAARAVRP